jgi:hypothetical protein
MDSGEEVEFVLGLENKYTHTHSEKNQFKAISKVKGPNKP